MVTANHTYKMATANREALEALSDRLTATRRLLCDVSKALGSYIRMSRWCLKYTYVYIGSLYPEGRLLNATSSLSLLLEAAECTTRV